MTENPADQFPEDERPVDDVDDTDQEAPADAPADPYEEGGYTTPDPAIQEPLPETDPDSSPDPSSGSEFDEEQ